MIRKVIEYLRKKNKITVEDLVVEICSGNMYYKYIAGTKNMSAKNLKLIKERLGADDLTKEEVDEYKKDLNKITLKIMRYYSSKKELEKDVEPLIELENQLILNEELFIDYIIVKMNYLLLYNNLEEIGDLLLVLHEYYNIMSQTSKLCYLKIDTAYKRYKGLSIVEEVNEFDKVLSQNTYNSNYGSFYVTHALNYIKIKERVKALKAAEVATELFQRDMNLVGQVKALNVRIMLLMENDKYKEAIEILLVNYENCKQIKNIHEMHVVLCNIINCYLGLNDNVNAIKYWEILKKKIFNINDDQLIKYYLNNTVVVCLLTNFEYYNLNDQLIELINIITPHRPFSNTTINNLLEYHSFNDDELKITFVEKTLLSSLIGKAHFTYCKWLLDTCVRHFKRKRMYKKAIEFETVFMEEFREYYFN